jgi:hypothetical protein
METNGSKHTSGTVVAPELPPANIGKTASAETSRREQTEGLRGEISRLRGEVEDLREQQRALQHDPHSEDSDPGK